MNVSRDCARLILLAILALGCMGMGGFGDTQILTKIPTPDRPFTVTITDSENITYSASDFTVEGMTLVPAQMGKAAISVDFADVKSVDMLFKGEHVAAVIDYKDGTSSDVTMLPKTAFYGKTKHGLMRLYAQDIRTIIFQ